MMFKNTINALNTCTILIMKKGPFVLDQADAHARENQEYERVLVTTEHMQYVEMHLEPGQEMGRTTHPDTTRYFYVHAGQGVARVDGRVFSVSTGSMFVVPANLTHNVTALSGASGLWLHTTYAPPHAKEERKE